MSTATIDLTDVEFLTVPEASKLLRISEYSLREQLKAGKLPGIKIGTKWRIPRSVLSGETA